MLVLKNDNCQAEIENGIIKSFKFNKEDINLADSNGETGTAAFTLKSDDITNCVNRPDFTPYTDRCSVYDKVQEKDGKIYAYDSENKISTEYSIEDGCLVISSCTDNENISEFGINLDLNFIGKKGIDYKEQLIASSPYSSYDGEYQYYLMTRPRGDFFVAAMLSVCDGWKNDYYVWGHFIKRVKLLASFDKVYGGSGKRHIKVAMFAADTIDEVFSKLERIYSCPICTNIISGGFDGTAKIKLYGSAQRLEIISDSGEKNTITVASDIVDIKMKSYGIHTVIPYNGNKKGMSTTVWNGENVRDIFNKSCDAIQRPYHPDDNICEGGCFLWAMLANMNYNKSNTYESIAAHELDIIMCRTNELIPRKTIVPYKTEYPPYHVYKSDRVQEQFFGVSILLEAFEYYKSKEYLEFAVATLKELTDNNMKNGMIFRGDADYTTVCAPVIAICDMANKLKEIDDKRFSYFEKKAIEVAEFLLKRGFDFPTEGIISDETDIEREDGSISCTALSVLYVCYKIKYDERYISFAEKILKLHNGWKIYSPDCRMTGSSFRTWETIWEGDGEGPAICAGHAWTIWRAEALYYLGMLTKNKDYLEDSWNGFITNFAKIQKDGTMYACYEPDYIRGGGIDFIKKDQKQLEGEDLSVKYKIAHSFPEHIDSSLSRYAWVRAVKTWMSKNNLV